MSALTIIGTDIGENLTLEDLNDILTYYYPDESEATENWIESSATSFTLSPIPGTDMWMGGAGRNTLTMHLTLKAGNFVESLSNVGCLFSVEITNSSSSEYWACLEQTLTANTTIYTYGITLTNADAENSQSTLQNSTFNLCDSSGNALSFVEINGIYYLSNSSSAATSLVTDSEGIVSIYGLDVGTYSITQIVAAGGYALNTTKVEIELADDDLDGLLDYDSGDDNGIYEVTFTNMAGYSLPTTGSFGTMIFTVLGIVLIATGGVLIIVKSRKNKVNIVN